MSSTNKTANYELSQFVGTDIPSILNDYNGDMRKIDTAIKAVANAEGSSAVDIASLQSTVGQHTTEISGIDSAVTNISGRVVNIESKIPANASENNQLITSDEVEAKIENIKIRYRTHLFYGNSYQSCSEMLMAVTEYMSTNNIDELTCLLDVDGRIYKLARAVASNVLYFATETMYDGTNVLSYYLKLGDQVSLPESYKIENGIGSSIITSKPNIIVIREFYV